MEDERVQRLLPSCRNALLGTPACTSKSCRPPGTNPPRSTAGAFRATNSCARSGKYSEKTTLYPGHTQLARSRPPLFVALNIWSIILFQAGIGAEQFAPGRAQAAGPHGPEPGPAYLSSHPSMLKPRIAANPGLPGGLPGGAQMSAGAPWERYLLQRASALLSKHKFAAVVEFQSCNIENREHRRSTASSRKLSALSIISAIVDRWYSTCTHASG